MPRPLSGPVELVGPLGVRPFHLSEACQAHVGHEHHYDHTTIVISGRIQVLYSDGTISKDLGPGDMIPIAKNVRHTVKALEADTRYYCVFSHRDFDGMVVESYIGNPDAYDEVGDRPHAQVQVRTSLTGKLA